MSFLQTSTSLGEKLRRNLISAKNVVIFHIKGKNMTTIAGPATRAEKAARANKTLRTRG